MESFPQIPDHFWCPTDVEIGGEKLHFPLPPGASVMGNKIGFLYEADAFKEAMEQGERKNG